MRIMTGGTYWSAVRKTVLPEWLSMNGLMAAMVPIMVILMTRDPSAMDPVALRFWGVMSLATLVGALFAYPVNVWLVGRGLKHGMGTVYVLGRGGHTLDTERRLMAQSGMSPRAGATGAPEAPHKRRHERREAVPRRGETVLVTLATLAALAAGAWIAARFGGL